MKSAIILFAMLSLSMANQATLFAALSSQMKSATTVEGVFDTVAEMIADLKASIQAEQGDADARNVTEVAQCTETISTLLSIEKDALDTYNDAQAHTKFLEDELATTNDHIDFIQARIDRNANKLADLKEQRCAENELFVDDLMSHKEAQALIDWLKEDLTTYFAEAAAGGSPSFAQMQQIKNAVEMLQTYTNSNGVVWKVTKWLGTKLFTSIFGGKSITKLAKGTVNQLRSYIKSNKDGWKQDLKDEIHEMGAEEIDSLVLDMYGEDGSSFSEEEIAELEAQMDEIFPESEDEEADDDSKGASYRKARKAKKPKPSIFSWSYWTSLVQIKQLIGDEILYGESYDATTSTEQVDNARAALEAADASGVSGQRPTLSGDLEADLDKLLTDLKQHMADSIADLEAREIEASHDFALWRAEIQKENIGNEAELARKNQYKTKLEADLPTAQAYEANMKSDWETAKAAREAMQEECRHKAEYYASETARRNDEIAACDQCLGIFEDDLADTTEYTEERAEHGTDYEKEARRIEDYSLDRGDYQEAGGYVAL